MTTLLQGVNAVLKRHRLIHGTSGDLPTLTNSAIQIAIDLSVQCWNEAIIDLFLKADRPMPSELSSGTITLVSGQRSYALQDDVVQIRWPLIDTTNSQYIDQYSGGYEKMRSDQINPSAYTGLPNFAAISPVSGQIYMDMSPTSSEEGRQYGYIYDKSLILSSATDTFPFNASVYQMMIAPVTELVRRELKKTFDIDLYDKRMAQSAELLTKEPLDRNYMPDAYEGSDNDPLSS